MAGSDIALASVRGYTRRWLTKTTWRETWREAWPGQDLILRQSPLIDVSEVTADGTVLMRDTDYRIDWHRSLITLLPLGAWTWSCVNPVTVITYVAGFDPLPADLQAVIDQAGAAIDADGSGSLAGITSIDMPDVGSVRFNGSAATGEGLLPVLQPYEAMLTRYRDNALLWAPRPFTRIEQVPP